MIFFRYLEKAAIVRSYIIILSHYNIGIAL